MHWHRMREANTFLKRVVGRSDELEVTVLYFQHAHFISVVGVGKRGAY